jgi:hypothetical protein
MSAQSGAGGRFEQLRSPTDVVDVSEFFGEETFDETFVTLTDEEAAELNARSTTQRESLRLSGPD